MLNFRKLKQDFSPNILKDGKTLNEKEATKAVKIVKLAVDLIRLHCEVEGSFDKTYKCEIEIDRRESTITDSQCSCPYKYDCQHLSAVLFYLEDNLDGLLVEYSKEAGIDKVEADDAEKAKLLEAIKDAEKKEKARKGKKVQKELIQEYVSASKMLGRSPFFLPDEELALDTAELAVIILNPQQDNQSTIDVSFALKLPYRSKPLNIVNSKEFLDSIKYGEPFYIGNKQYFFSFNSFDTITSQIIRKIIDFARFYEQKEEKYQKVVSIELESFGSILAHVYENVPTSNHKALRGDEGEGELQNCPCFFVNCLEEPLKLAKLPTKIKIDLEYLEVPAPKILLSPHLLLDNNEIVNLHEPKLLECSQPGFIHNNVFYRFESNIRRKHLRNLSSFQEVTIPEPLFGTFVENSIPELMKYALVSNREVMDKFVTLPFVGELKAECNINYLDGELEACLNFIYGDKKVPIVDAPLTIEHLIQFVNKEGILARNLTAEQKIIKDLFQDFNFDPVQGVFSIKNDKKIVEFMTDVIPRNQHHVTFNCPQNLLDQFLYDNSHFTLSLRESDRVDQYEVDLQVDGFLNGLTLEQLWDCLSSKKSFIELLPPKRTSRKKSDTSKIHKILVLDLEKIAPVIQVFDEIGISRLDNHKELRPLWSLASIEPSQFKNLPINFSMTDKLKYIQDQMLGNKEIITKEIPNLIQANLRSYQTEGVAWLDRLRQMHLSGILADDMGLGKTLQAIIAITQFKIDHPKALSLIVCPTSLVYNWKEEFYKFNPRLKTLPVDGTPSQRKKLQNEILDYDVIITSYSLLQKDIEFYKTLTFGYCILDEAQHIKNRGTRNAKSVKMIQASHRLILTGTPIENSLDELWSLFDFLMPGLLSTYDRFIEKYIRNPYSSEGSYLDNLRKKVSPFILRRMKKDVLSELPSVSEIVYHCHLSEPQRELYHSYAESAREELSQLVKKEGFDRVQIHVLATLTRLKQICCHPAIFAKETPEYGDSAKYDMLLELLQTLIEGKHKTVIFSQYTRMLNIMRKDLERLGISFEYLDGSSKNRLGIVKKFNEDQNISVFLVSLKAGGSGLNLVGADTVIHYDMWWNPAVENQATDRVHRLGQKNAVSSYKLVTLNTIEEKILELQNRKRNLVTKVVSSDEEAITKLTWEEVLELLQT